MRRELTTPARAHCLRGLRLLLAATAIAVLLLVRDWTEPRVARGATYTVTNTADSGAGSLRQAIVDANNNTGADTIDFNIGAGGAQTISPASNLPSITGPVTIDGTTQTGSCSGPCVTIDGGDVRSTGLHLQGGDSTVRGVQVNRFTVEGIALTHGDNNVVSGNYIGTDGATDRGNGNYGVFIAFSSTGNTIGGTTASERNVISGNTNGIHVDDSASTGTIIRGNYIGLNAEGTSAIANSTGIQMNASGSTIGGTDVSHRNVIASPGGDGIRLSLDADITTIQGNYVGTDAAGTTGLGFNYGIAVESDYNTIGGTSLTTPGGACAGACNLVSGGGVAGWGITVFSGVSNTIRGNYVGTTASGLASLPNDMGIAISWFGATTIASGTSIGDGSAAGRNLISGNLQDGILIDGPYGQSTAIIGNYIGVDTTGAAALPNGDAGIDIDDSDFNYISSNVISGNDDDNVRISGAGSTNNTVELNKVGTNAAGTASVESGSADVGIYMVNAVSSSISSNIVSGNGVGILIEGGGASGGGTGHVIRGNIVGTDLTLAAPIPNTDNGIWINNGSNNIVGGDGQGNVVAGNNRGIYIKDDGATNPASNNTVLGNIIGTNGSGATSLGNTLEGILIEDGSDNIIGGDDPTDRNVISKNGAHGVRIWNTAAPGPASGNRIIGNYIGLTPDGTLALGNLGSGVLIEDAPDNLVGGLTPGEGNVIAYNAAAGVTVTGATATGNGLRANSMHSNVGAAIDLVSGGNGGQAPPTISPNAITAAGITGTTCAGCSIDVFSDSAEEGRVYHGYANADGSGNFVWAAGVFGPNATISVTSTTGNTSELSAPVSLQLVRAVGQPGSAGFAGDGLPADDAAVRLTLPRGQHRYLNDAYIADSGNNRIRRYALGPPLGAITTIAGGGSGVCASASVGDGGPATSALLCNPHDVWANTTGIYIADTDNCRIRRIGGDGIISTVAGTTGCGYTGDGVAATSSQLNKPAGVAVDATGNIYIADTENHRIRRVDVVTGLIITIAGDGMPGLNGDGPATARHLNRPFDLAGGFGAGSLIFVDRNNHMVRRVDPSLTLTTIAGTGSAGYTGDGGAASVATLNFPEALATNAIGDIFVADTSNHVIREIRSSTGVIDTIVGDGTPGSGGLGGLPTSAQLNKPAGVLIGSVCPSNTYEHTVGCVHGEGDPLNDDGSTRGARSVTSCSMAIGGVRSEDWSLVALLLALLAWKRRVLSGRKVRSAGRAVSHQVRSRARAWSGGWRHVHQGHRATQ
jgi:hypothetical protein